MRKKILSIAPLRPFLLLWSSQSVSALGTAMTNYALVIWAYQQTGTATSLTTLTLCSFLPTIFFRFIAGAIADRWNKKIILLTADLFAACGSLVILALLASNALTVMWLYVINFLLSLMNAFQVPAAYVATSLLIPKAYYTKTGGLQSASDALISILSPVLGSMMLATSGLKIVLAFDLFSFCIAWLTLFFLPIPSLKQNAETKKETFRRNIAAGFRFLKQQRSLLRLILLIALINFLAKLGADGQMPAFILSRTENNSSILGAVQSSMALGIFAGGILVTFLKPPRNDTKRILVLCSLIFLTSIVFSICQNTVLWCLFAFLQYLFAALMNIYWGTKMRNAVPIHMQGRVFSTRDTIQNATIPLGLYLGGVLTDHVFEPIMVRPSFVSRIFASLVGNTSGAGIASLFFLVSVLGFLVCCFCIFFNAFQNE